MPVQTVRSDLIASPHGFFGRTGGVSSGDLASLNCGIGSGDDPGNIAENRRRTIEAIAPDARLVGAYQVHSADCITVTEAWSDDARPHGDALVTGRPGLALSILTADCAPVLFADPSAGIVGAAHAGWKGALGGVTDATLDAMVRLGADRARVVAAIGPCIGRKSYEVDDAFARRFETHDRANERFFTAGREGHHFFDLEGYIAHRLSAAGVTRIDALGRDTLADPARFFSYRRATLAGEAGYGRQISIIVLEA